MLPLTTEQLLVRLAIDALNAEFAWRVDHQDGHGVAELFLPDGRYGRENGVCSIGREAIAAAYAGRRSRGPRTARHLFTNLRLVFDPAMSGRVRGTTTMLLFADDGLPPLPAVPLAVSDFEDEYVLDTDGGRQVVLPLGTPAS
jgi:hypothetical protein